MNRFTKGIWRFEIRYNYLTPESPYYIIDNGNTIGDYEDWGFTQHDAHLIATTGTSATKLAEQGYDAIKVLELLPEFMWEIDNNFNYGKFGELLEQCRGDV